MSRALITGSSGKTGMHLVPLLLMAGVDVNAASRQPQSIHPKAGVTPTKFDWFDKGTWEPALAGVDKVYLVKPETEEMDVIIQGFVHLLETKPIDRVILLSEVAAGTRSAVPERGAELAVEQSTLPWTIIRPNWFVQDLADPNFFGNEILDSGVLRMTTGGSPTAWIDAWDIANVAASLLIDGGQRSRQHFTLTGPEALTTEEMTSRLSAAGFDVRPQEETIEKAELRMAADGYPPNVIAYMARIHASIVDGETSFVTDSVERISGVAPRKVDEFLNEWSQKAKGN